MGSWTTSGWKPSCQLPVGLRLCDYSWNLQLWSQPWVLKRLSQMLACNDLTSHVYITKLHPSPENWVWEPLDGWTYSLPKEGVGSVLLPHSSSASVHTPCSCAFLTVYPENKCLNIVSLNSVNWSDPWRKLQGPLMYVLTPYLLLGIGFWSPRDWAFSLSSRSMVSE